MSSSFLRRTHWALAALRTAVCGAGLLASQASLAASFPAVEGTGGAVAAAETEATEAGLEILRQGGNAVDAAVATALALVVVHPEAGNLGGGGFAVIKMGDQLDSLDFRETAPAAATAKMYQDAEGRLRPQASELGPLAAGVPGSPQGLWELHQRYGSLPWPQIVEPARRLAAEGFVVTTRLHKTVAREQDDLATFPETAAVWLPNGRPPPAGSRLRIPELAESLRRLGELGPSALTRGSAAAAIERVSAKYGGLLTAADLEGYQPQWRPVIRFQAFGWNLATMDLPATGGIILAQVLIQLETLEWQSLPRFGAERAHLLAETLRRSFADRFLMGDPETTELDSRTALGKAWLDWRRSTINRRRATPSPAVASTAGPPPAEGTDTTHLAVIDEDGNVVSMTVTLNGAFGCKLLVPELGYFLNNEMDDFAAAPGQPNTYGLIQGEANAIAAGKRMLSSMSPTIAWQEQQILALGARGGSMIPTSTVQVLLNILVDGDPLQAAIDRPRIHHQWLPDRLQFELDALSPETRRDLQSLGHQLELLETTAKVNAALARDDGSLAAAGDPRGPATAGVVQPKH